MATNRRELVDTKLAVRAVDHCIALFGKPPRAYAYDRGGHSLENVAELKRKGVKDVGLAPRGRVAWAIAEDMKERSVRERALVEAGIGTLKTRRYGFNRPRARSAEMMGVCGQMAVLGFNLNKLAKGLAKPNDMAVVTK